jgi:hypothetical protein
MTRVIFVRAKADAIWLGTSDIPAKYLAKIRQRPAEVQGALGGLQMGSRYRKSSGGRPEL